MLVQMWKIGLIGLRKVEEITGRQEDRNCIDLALLSDLLNSKIRPIEMRGEFMVLFYPTLVAPQGEDKTSDTLVSHLVFSHLP